MTTGWGTRDIPDQTGRTFVVTGANSGLGAQATTALVGAGATVVMACRNVEKANAVAEPLGERAIVRRLDLADLSSVRAFAEATGPCDVLMNNAGIMAVPLGRTVDGHEMQFGTNHLGHFALTLLLRDRIADRVVTMSSFAHWFGGLDLDDVDWTRRSYSRSLAYGASKLANLLFAYELDRRLRADGSAVRSIAAHPGYAATELQSHTESPADAVMALGNRIVAQSAAAGALPELFAATAPDARGGGFYGPRIAGLRGAPVPARSSRRSHDAALAGRLWDLSEDLVGVRW